MATDKQRTAIRVERLSKLYRIGAADRTQDSFAGAFMGFLRSPLDNYRKYRSLYDFRDVLDREEGATQGPQNVLWALKDVSFEVKRGEVLGIVGPNGSGKSTLLKILSRITPPTTGSATITGRVASLLEVGTGFHPELTGRENIFLNGTVLGMTKREVERHLEEIVDFSGVEPFLDTPVKRYSSGMRVRLAFSVAAHLQPEILIIDEVLAVGDASFQEKCLGKMGEVANSGRTVLFVSHNLPAVKSLCSRAILLDHGAVCFQGPVEDVVSGYLEALDSRQDVSLDERRDRVGGNEFRFTGARFMDRNTGAELNVVESGQSVVLRIFYRSRTQRRLRDVGIGVVFSSLGGGPLFGCRNKAVGSSVDVDYGYGYTDCVIPRLPLKGGRYTFDLYAEQNGASLDRVTLAGVCQVLGSDYYGTGVLPAPGQPGVLIDYAWQDVIGEAVGNAR